MKNFLILVLMWPVGMLVGVFTISQMVIIARFAIPSCRKGLASGEMLSTAPLNRYRLSLVINMVILVAATAAVLAWSGHSTKVGYFIGLGLVTLPSLGAASSKHARANMTAFLNSNRSHLSPAFVTKAENWLSSAESHPSHGGGQTTSKQ